MDMTLTASLQTKMAFQILLGHLTSLSEFPPLSFFQQVSVIGNAYVDIRFFPKL